MVFLFIVALTQKFFMPRKSLVYAICGGSFAGVGNASYGVLISSYGTAFSGVVILLSVPLSVGLSVLVLHEKYSNIEALGLSVISIGLAVAFIL
jgi:drug/metabolite transporter (DMT)-like permease